MVFEQELSHQQQQRIEGSLCKENTQSQKIQNKTHKIPRQKPPIKLQSAVCLFLLLVLHGDDDQAHVLQSQLLLGVCL